MTSTVSTAKPLLRVFLIFFPLSYCFVQQQFVLCMCSACPVGTCGRRATALMGWLNFLVGHLHPRPLNPSRRCHCLRPCLRQDLRRDERSSGDERPAAVRRLTEGVVLVYASGVKTRGGATTKVRQGNRRRCYARARRPVLRSGASAGVAVPADCCQDDRYEDGCLSLAIERVLCKRTAWRNAFIILEEDPAPMGAGSLHLRPACAAYGLSARLVMRPSPPSGY